MLAFILLLILPISQKTHGQHNNGRGPKGISDYYADYSGDNSGRNRNLSPIRRGRRQPLNRRHGDYSKHGDYTKDYQSDDYGDFGANIGKEAQKNKGTKRNKNGDGTRNTRRNKKVANDYRGDYGSDYHIKGQPKKVAKDYRGDYGSDYNIRGRNKKESQDYRGDYGSDYNIRGRPQKVVSDYKGDYGSDYTIGGPPKKVTNDYRGDYGSDYNIGGQNRRRFTFDNDPKEVCVPDAQGAIKFHSTHRGTFICNLGAKEAAFATDYGLESSMDYGLAQAGESETSKESKRQGPGLNRIISGRRARRRPRNRQPRESEDGNERKRQLFNKMQIANDYGTDYGSDYDIGGGVNRNKSPKKIKFDTNHKSICRPDANGEINCKVVKAAGKKEGDYQMDYGLDYNSDYGLDYQSTGNRNPVPKKAAGKNEGDYQMDYGLDYNSDYGLDYQSTGNRKTVPKKINLDKNHKSVCRPDADGRVNCKIVKAGGEKVADYSTDYGSDYSKDYQLEAPPLRNRAKVLKKIKFDKNHKSVCRPDANGEINCQVVKAAGESGGDYGMDYGLLGSPRGRGRAIVPSEAAGEDYGMDYGLLGRPHAGNRANGLKKINFDKTHKSVCKPGPDGEVNCKVVKAAGDDYQGGEEGPAKRGLKTAAGKLEEEKKKAEEKKKLEEQKKKQEEQKQMVASTIMNLIGGLTGGL